MIRVSLYSTLRKYQVGDPGGEGMQIPYKPGMTINTLIGHLGIPKDHEVALIAVNGELKGQNYDLTLQTGDTVALYGVIDGG
jgi:hypothetical protein